MKLVCFSTLQGTKWSNIPHLGKRNNHRLKSADKGGDMVVCRRVSHFRPFQFQNVSSLIKPFTLRILGPSNGRAWTCIEGVRVHFWGVRILKGNIVDPHFQAWRKVPKDIYPKMGWWVIPQISSRWLEKKFQKTFPKWWVFHGDLPIVECNKSPTQRPQKSLFHNDFDASYAKI